MCFLVIISYCEIFSLTTFLPSFETLKASVNSFVMLQCVHKAHFLSFSFKSVSSVFRQFLLLCDTGQAFSSLAPTLVHQAFCSSFYSPPLHLSGSKIWLVFGSSTYLLAHTGCSYLSSVSNACSITYQHFHMVAFSRSFCECAIYFWGSDFPVDKLYFFF